MKMEPIVSSEMSAIKSQTPGNYPKRNKLHLQHGESLRTLMNFIVNNQETIQTIYLYTVLVQGISATLTLIPLTWKIW